MIYAHNTCNNYSYLNLNIHETSYMFEGQYIRVSDGNTSSDIILVNIYIPLEDTIDNYSTFNNNLVRY